ncbi:Uncharacterized protein OBRU01_17728 [Operophtera brumata]|uniref:Beat protein n=1 Tax=Operophtera brumata TaxID=104452 RepID=A0A0L7L027_OPEBR|nr:Uncharacterized protein OBRU01_17728 [Operophtera brumata]
MAVVSDHGVTPLELLDLHIPGHVPLGTRAALSCRWQLGPADVLYSVKWYKDGKEFFRHVPRDVEPRRKFPLPGVDVEMLLDLHIPAHVPLGTCAALSCRWQLGPADLLYSVKWYKDGKEFFRHVPRDVEPRRKFPLLEMGNAQWRNWRC